MDGMDGMDPMKRHTTPHHSTAHHTTAGLIRVPSVHAVHFYSDPSFLNKRGRFAGPSRRALPVPRLGQETLPTTPKLLEFARVDRSTVV